jgi:predicted AAA+ superfamily ATPase
MYNRNILTELKKWKTNSLRKPLILRGARQVGKTTVVNGFAESYGQYIYLNLEIEANAKPFRNYVNIEQLTEQLFFLHNKNIDKKKDTLLFIDEIQEVPAAVNILRYFYEEVPELHVIAAGSLLETVISEQIRIPVGRVEYRVVRPFSFDEFLQAMGETSAIQQFHQVPLKEFVHDKLLNLFHTYVLLGGMPAIVSHYVQNKNLTALSTVYESLIVSYMDDVEKYARNNNLVQVIRHVIRTAYLEAGSRIKFQGFGHSNYGSREVGEAMRTLEKTLLLHLIYPVTHASIPILPDKRKSPRLQVLDTGMLNHFAGLQKEIIASPNLDVVYQGKVVEHMVGQELLAYKFNVLNELNFWVRDKKDAEAEVDFVIDYEGRMIPIEVKSGVSGRLRSLHSFMDMVKHDLAIRLYGGLLKIDNVKTLQGKEYRLLNMPYYLAGKIEEYLKWMENTTSPSK